MTGERLKEIIFKFKVSQSEIARRLGMSHQSLNQMLTAADVKSSLLERIAQVLNVPISHLYGERDETQSAVATGDSSIAVNNNSGNIAAGDNRLLQERIKFLEQQLKDKECLLEEKERLIKVLMER